MGKSRTQRRFISGIKIHLFDENTSLGWRVKYDVSASLALQMVAQRRWREVWCENGDLAGVQPLRPVQPKTLGQALIERLIGVTITLDEVQRNAGLYGRSRTMGMPEWKRLRRHARFDESKILPPEDATERAIEKVRAWPYPASVIGADGNGAPIFGDRAVRVYPHPPKNNPRKGRHANQRPSR